MSDDRKVRADAVLKTLPEDRQQEIFQWLNTPGNTLVRCVERLRQDGIKTNRDSLSHWYSWYSLRLKFKETERDTLNFQELVKEELPDLPQEKVTQLGSAYFNMQAIRGRGDGRRSRPVGIPTSDPRSDATTGFVAAVSAEVG